MTQVSESALQKALAVPSRLTRGSVVQLRMALSRAAAVVANAKRPTQRLGAASLRMNNVAHDGIEQLVRHQVHVVEGMMDEGAQRLQLAAEAGSLRSMLNEQVSLLPETRTRLVKDVRTALDILGETRTGLTAAVREEFAAIRESAKPAVKAARDTADKVGDIAREATVETSDAA